MSLFFYDDHADNPPETWRVVKVADRLWHLESKEGACLDSFKTKREAEINRTMGWAVRLYEQERRWYAGESVPSWKPFTEDVIDRQRAAKARFA